MSACAPKRHCRRPQVQPRSGATEPRCVACEGVAGEGSGSHPWLNGAACPRCLLTCSYFFSKRCTTGGSFECEKCSRVNGLTIFHQRLVCFKCMDKKKQNIPKLRHDWMERVLQCQLTKGFRFGGRKALRVLSMFDGIGTGLLALDTLGLEVEEYFSCEIDEAALAVLNCRFHGRIKHLGSVASLSTQKLQSLGQIDLLLGGSPCNQLTLANPLRKGLFDPVDTGVLFFDFNRVLKFLQASSFNSGNTMFWLYENVAAMPHDFQETISKTLQCKPALWDSIQFVPAKRARFFWGNLPDLHEVQIVDRPPPSLEFFLEPYRKPLVSSLPTLTTTFFSQTTGLEMQLPVIEDGNEDGLLITERERLFGFPSHFTDGPDLSIHQRQCLLGRAWCVPVIEKILSPLTKVFKLKPK